MTSADASPINAATCARTWKIASSPSSTMTGIAATSADSSRLLPTGVYPWVQLMPRMMPDRPQISKARGRERQQAYAKLGGPMADFVSRAGQKLNHALAHFDLDVSGRTCADLGSNTGGFVDVLLRRGVAKVYAI